MSSDIPEEIKQKLVAAGEAAGRAAAAMNIEDARKALDETAAAYASVTEGAPAPAAEEAADENDLGVMGAADTPQVPVKATGEEGQDGMGDAGELKKLPDEGDKHFAWRQADREGDEPLQAEGGGKKKKRRGGKSQRVWKKNKKGGRQTKKRRNMRR